jgi:hypothetical protein
VNDADHEHAPMLTLGQAIDRRFAHDDPWARQALAALGSSEQDDDVYDVAKGWLRIGGDSGTLVDALFVLTPSRLGFAQTILEDVPPQSIPLRSIVALDAIEGMPYPLVTVEVQLSGNVAILVGWPDSFCSTVVDVLTADLAAATESRPTPVVAESLPDDFADPASTANAADPAALDQLDPSPWQEQDLSEPAPGDWTTSAPESREEPSTDDAGTPVPQFAPPPPENVPEPSAPVPPAGLFGIVDQTGSFDAAVGRPPATPSRADEQAIDEPFEAQPSDEPSFEALRSDELRSEEPTPDEPTPDELRSDEPGDEVEPGDQPPVSSFHSATSALFAASDPEVEERADAFFSDEHPEPAEEIASFAEEAPLIDPAPPTGGMTPAIFANRLIPWPEPFRSVVYLGENPSHPRRRKGVTLAFSPAGVTAVSSGFSAWKHHIGWNEITELEFQGADEVKFTYDHRIDVNATAAIVGLTDGTVMVFEIKSRRPATLRSSMAPIMNAVTAYRASIHGTDSFQY